jgi:hypothetical protein
MMATQTQQYDIYAAEVGVPNGTSFSSVAEAQAWVDGLRDTWWWPRFYWMIQRIEVGRAAKRNAVNARGRKIPGEASVGWWDASREAGRIEMQPYHFNVQTITHEIAHVVAEVLRGSTSHDPDFARTYAILTYLISGSDQWLKLQAGYERHGVDYLQA